MIDSDAIEVSEGEDEKWQREGDDDEGDGSYAKRGGSAASKELDEEGDEAESMGEGDGDDESDSKASRHPSSKARPRMT